MQAVEILRATLVALLPRCKEGLFGAMQFIEAKPQ
jgi:hypothetical protein